MPALTNPWELLDLWLKVTNEAAYLEMKKQTEAAIAFETQRKIMITRAPVRCNCGQAYNITIEVRKSS